MTKHIEDLVKDIETLVTEGKEKVEGHLFGRRTGNVFERGLYPRDKDKPSRVWFSNVGGPCTRKLWYKLNAAGQGEPLLPSTRVKFLYGDIIEELLLSLAREAGHVVEQEQRSVSWNGVTGRIDAVIDGVLIDVKSASSYSFKKFNSGLRREDDSFGYIEQLGGYLLSAREEGFVTDTNRAGFLVANKETGKLHLDMHEFTDVQLGELADRILSNKAQGEAPEAPERAFEPTPEGKSGNQKLGTNCSYCEFKKICWPGLRTFLYSNKPMYLTDVIKEPNVPELLEEVELDE